MTRDTEDRLAGGSSNGLRLVLARAEFVVGRVCQRNRHETRALGMRTAFTRPSQRPDVNPITTLTSHSCLPGGFSVISLRKSFS